MARSVLRILRRGDGTELKVSCIPLVQVRGFTRPHAVVQDDDQGIRDDDFQPVLEFLTGCSTVVGQCQPHIVVIEVRRDDQTANPQRIVEAGSYDEIVRALDKFPIASMVPHADATQSSRLVRHFHENKHRFLEEIRPEFDLDLDDERQDQRLVE